MPQIIKALQKCGKNSFRPMLGYSKAILFLTFFTLLQKKEESKTLRLTLLTMKNYLLTFIILSSCILFR